METAGGGWTLLVNLASRDDAIHDYDDVGFWLNENTVGEAGAALTDDYKSSHYYRFGDTSEVMVLAHDQGRPLGWASYFLKP